MDYTEIPKEINDLTKTILDCSFRIHSALGPGLLESAYEACLEYEMKESGLYVERQKQLPLLYKEVRIDTGYRLDFLIESKVIIEVKSIEVLADIHIAQVLTYLRLSGSRIGLLINFNVKHLKDGIKRLVY